VVPVLTWLVTGAGGMLGRELVARLSAEFSASPGSGRVVAVRRPAFDVTEPASVGAAFARHRPDIVINCAAYTAVDAAESDEATALRVNGTGPRHVAEACVRYKARLIHVSTDYVFPGHARLPYPEYHPTGPGTAYGRTKLAGERAVLGLLPETSAVVRTAWLYGTHGRNFVRTMLELEKRRQIVDVVADQLGQPTWAADLAGWITTLGRTSHAIGIFHGTNAGVASWSELATAVFAEIGADPARVRPTTTEAYPGKAPRPGYTVLGHDRWAEIGVAPPRDWHEALRAALPGLR
jgi:dTDP-4-dehydrorhamnose reductase